MRMDVRNRKKTRKLLARMEWKLWNRRREKYKKGKKKKTFWGQIKKIIATVLIFIIINFN